VRFLFDDFEGVLRTLLVGVVAYVALVVVLRSSGKRTLSKMNAFDLVVTVALGSTLATVLLSRDTPLAEGVVAILVLAGMQRLITEERVPANASTGRAVEAFDSRSTAVSWAWKPRPSS